MTQDNAPTPEGLAWRDFYRALTSVTGLREAELRDKMEALGWHFAIDVSRERPSIMAFRASTEGDNAC